MSSDRTIDEGVTRSDLIHERLRESPVRRWLLLDGNRYVLSGLLAALVFVVTAAIGFAGFIPVTDPATATTLVAAIVGGTLPFITIVLAINQLVLSTELGWPGDLADRFAGMTGFRHDVEDVTGVPVSPAAPADFLQLLVDTIDDRIARLADAVDAAEARERDGGGGAGEADVVGSGLDEAMDDVTAAITDEAAVVSTALEGADIGTFDALSAVLGNFNGAHRYAVRLIRVHHADDLDDEAIRTLDELIELLGYLAIARQSFKTLYMQYELAHLSKLLLYVGFPTLLGGGLFMMTYGSIIAAVEGSATLVLVVSAVVTLVFLPFIVLLVYTFRIATIASRTADFGPFVPRVDVGGDSNGD